jgi:membrane protein required for colicin V production
MSPSRGKDNALLMNFFYSEKVNYLARMGILDIVLGVVLVYGCIKGIWRGFFVEAASLLSLFVGVFIAIKFADVLATVLTGFLSWEHRSVRITAFILLFIGVITGMTLLARFMTTLASISGVGIINRLGGGIAGLVKTVLVLGMVLNLFARVNSSDAIVSKETLDTSVFYNPVHNTAAFLFPFAEQWFLELKNSSTI